MHPAENIPQETAEIEWRISQKVNDDICHPLCLIFTICLFSSIRDIKKTSGVVGAEGFKEGGGVVGVRTQRYMAYWPTD